MSKLKDLTGQRFGRLTVLERNGSDSYKNALWLCQCECGNLHTVAGHSLWRGETRSCGCLRKTNTYRIEGDVSYIVCASGDEIIVDTEDLDILKQYQWGVIRGYATTNFNRTTTSLHRIVTNAPKGYVVDHINHNTLDNRKCNLRVCTQSNNAMNRKKAINNTTGYVGVVYKKDCHKWEASIRVDKKRKYLGLYETPELAYKARKEAEEKYYGKFAYQG